MDQGPYQRQEGAPGMTASRLSQPPRTPPQCLSMSSLRGMLISSSTVQGRLTWPLMQNSLVPAPQPRAGRGWDPGRICCVVTRRAAVVAGLGHGQGDVVIGPMMQDSWVPVPQGLVV